MAEKKAPIIGLTLDWRSSGHYSLYPWYAIRQNYADCLAKEGALPIMLPFLPDRIEEYLNQIDGLLITGGDFDIHPSFYGEEIKHHRVATIESRTEFEFFLTKEALKRNIPVLGICGGAQLLNVVLGGSLIQHIPEEIETTIEHEQPNPRTEPGHEVKVIKDTFLQRTLGEVVIKVNSAHHQAVKKPGNGVLVNAVAPDGVIEGIESPEYKFCMGIQWHPEFVVTPADRKIFQSFVQACQS